MWENEKEYIKQTKYLNAVTEGEKKDGLENRLLLATYPDVGWERIREMKNVV